MRHNNIFLHTVPSNILIFILNKKGNITATKIARQMKNSICQTNKTISELHKYDFIVKSNKEGRVRYIELTEKGRIVAENLNQIIHRMRDNY